MTDEGTAPSPDHYSPEIFFEETLERDEAKEVFEVVKKRFLRIDVREPVWIKRGSAVAYRGDLRFVRERVLQWRKAGQMFGRESVPMARVEGQGIVYCSDEGQHTMILRGSGQSLYVTGRHLMAFESSLEYEYHMAGMAGMLAGGIYVVKLSGSGLVALALKGDPLTLRVTPEAPVFTAPGNTVAWTEGLKPELKTQLEVRSVFGHGSGQEIQMRFQGTGYVVVQPKTDVNKGDPIKAVKSVIKKLKP